MIIDPALGSEENTLRRERDIVTDGTGWKIEEEAECNCLPVVIVYSVGFGRIGTVLDCDCFFSFDSDKFRHRKNIDQLR